MKMRTGVNIAPDGPRLAPASLFRPCSGDVEPDEGGASAYSRAGGEGVPSSDIARETSECYSKLQIQKAALSELEATIS